MAMGVAMGVVISVSKLMDKYVSSHLRGDQYACTEAQYGPRVS